MKINTTTEFRQKLKKQIQYISLDKVSASKNLNKLIFAEIAKIKDMPFNTRNHFSKIITSEN